VRGSVQPENSITNEANDHQMRNPLERQHVITAADLVLDSLDIMLDFRNMMF
jgi:hypothetical protein